MNTRTLALVLGAVVALVGAVLMFTLRPSARPPAVDERAAWKATRDSFELQLLDARRERGLLLQRVEDLERLARPDLIDTFEVSALQEAGLAHPVDSLRADLQRHPELIPYPGVLGGTMFFEDAHVLNGRWVFVSFEDGHVDGSMLLEYRIREGRIAWKRLASYLDEGDLP